MMRPAVFALLLASAGCGAALPLDGGSSDLAVSSDLSGDDLSTTGAPPDLSGIDLSTTSASPDLSATPDLSAAGPSVCHFDVDVLDDNCVFGP
jgi:hypothetical protein